MNSRIWSFHLDTLRVPKLVPHPALQPEAEVVDPAKGKTKVSPGPEGWNPALRGRILRVSGPRPKGKILESENANGPLSEHLAPGGLPPPRDPPTTFRPAGAVKK